MTVGVQYGLIPGLRNFGLEQSSPGLPHPNRHIIYPAWTANRKIPETLDSYQHSAFLKEKIHHLPGAAAAIIPSGRVLGTQGITFDRDGYLLVDPAKRVAGPDDWPERYSIIRPKVKRLEGRWGVLTGSGCEGFFHWMMDILPRISLIRQLSPHVDGWIIPRTSGSFLRESLELFGIPETRRFEITATEHVQADEIVVASNPSLPGNPPPWVIDLFCKEWQTKPVRTEELPRRFLISRINAQRRIIVNEDELFQPLSNLGFEKVYLEKLSVAKQSQIFRNAKVIIAPHGAGLTNLIHSTPSTSVLEIFSDEYVNVCFWAIANLVDVPYTYTTVKSVRQPSTKDKSIYNLYLDADKINCIIDWTKAVLKRENPRNQS